mmetsp:Transcript_17872/g.62700  ORF Transcript_17872/g.62700 Transcript_17872/m.62700 type:complete len:296 (+) Transcript_17872:797-1684(+)
MASRPRRWQWHQWPFRSMTLVALQPSRRRGRRPRHRRSLRPSRITDANRMLVVNTGKPVIGRTSTGWKSGRCSPSMGFRPGCPFFISVPRSRSSTGGARSLRMHARARVATGWPSKGIATPFISGASRADLTLASLQAPLDLGDASADGPAVRGDPPSSLGAGAPGVEEDAASCSHAVDTPPLSPRSPSSTASTMTPPPSPSSARRAAPPSCAAGQPFGHAARGPEVHMGSRCMQDIACKSVAVLTLRNAPSPLATPRASTGKGVWRPTLRHHCKEYVEIERCLGASMYKWKGAW